MLLTTRIVFFGTSEFAVSILEKMVEANMRPRLVITTPDSPIGRKQILSPPPVKVKAQKLGLKIIQPKTLKDPEVLNAILATKGDIGVLAAYGKIIPRLLIDVFPKGILNAHPSLLPRWRGPTPVQATILAGDEKAGTTILLMDEKVDHGPILAKRELELINDGTKISNIDYVTLHDKLARLSAELMIKTLPRWFNGEVSPVPQDHSQATFCKKFTREDAKIDWSKSAVEIERMVRALNPEPGTWAEFGAQGLQVKVLKILAAIAFQHSQEFCDIDKGEICVWDSKPVVKCGEGALVLERVQPEGGKPMPGADWLRGQRGLKQI